MMLTDNYPTCCTLENLGETSLESVKRCKAQHTLYRACKIGIFQILVKVKKFQIIKFVSNLKIGMNFPKNLGLHVIVNVNVKTYTNDFHFAFFFELF